MTDDPVRFKTPDPATTTEALVAYVVSVVAAVVVLGLMAMARFQPLRAEADPAPAAAPHYSVIETEGHNLIVTDNQSNMLYFYTIDKDKPIASSMLDYAGTGVSKSEAPASVRM